MALELATEPAFGPATEPESGVDVRLAAGMVQAMVVSRPSIGSGHFSPTFINTNDPVP